MNEAPGDEPGEQEPDAVPSSDPSDWRTPLSSGRPSEALARLRALAVVGRGAALVEREVGLLVEALIALRNRDYREAERLVPLLEGVTEPDARRYAVGFADGLAALQAADAKRRNPDAARERLLAAVGQPLTAAEAENNLGVLAIREADSERAERNFRSALKADPRHHRAITNLGNLDLEAGRVDEAIARYREAIRLNESYATAHNNLAAALKRAGKTGEAVKSLKRSQRLAFRTPDAARGATPNHPVGKPGGQGRSRLWIWFVAGGAIVIVLRLLR